MTSPFRIEILGAHHDRKSFFSDVAALDRYFAEQATQDVRRRVAACYVAVEVATGAVAGYYTLSAGGIALSEMLESLAKRLPRYPSVPVARLGRLAVAHACRGRSLGAALLWDAASRAVRSEVAMVSLVVDAKDETSAAFYRHHGFAPLGTGTHRMVLALAHIPR